MTLQITEIHLLKIKKHNKNGGKIKNSKERIPHHLKSLTSIKSIY